MTAGRSFFSTEASLRDMSRSTGALETVLVIPLVGFPVSNSEVVPE